MPERLNRGARETGRPGYAEVESLASQVLSVLAARTPAGTEHGGDDTVNRLVSAVRQKDDSERDRVVSELAADGVTAEDLINRHIPEAARRMGEAWCNDGMSFVDVTIGTARLQSLLRDLVRRSLPPQPSDPMAPQVLMVVRENDFHTLGAMVATQQMRRLGVGVHVAIGQSDPEILVLLASRDFDMVMISSSGSEMLESLGKFVENVRTQGRASVPVVIGGTVLGHDQDVTAMTGADFATADPEEALRRCGLKIPHQGADRRVTSG